MTSAPPPPPPRTSAPPPPPTNTIDPLYWVYDLETYPNLFSAVFLNDTTGEELTFEISDRKNDARSLYEFVHRLKSDGAEMVGFNSEGFDYPVLHHLMTTMRITASEAYDKAQAIIGSQNDDSRWEHTVWPSDRIVKQLDLYKVHHFDNRAKSTGLKALEVAMCSDSVEDLPFEVGTVLSSEQIDLTLSYNAHDVRETLKFFRKSRAMVDFRRELTSKYGVDFTNYNDTKIGKEYFIMELEKAGVACFDRSSGRKEPKQTKRPHGIPVGEIIFPYIKFDRPEFNRVLDYLRTVTIRDTKSAPEFKDLCAVVDGFQFDYGTGGIHGSIKGRIVRSSATHVIIDVDVASMYPNIAIANRVYPLHLTERFCDVYSDLYQQRKKHKKGTAENAMLKLALNGVYGDSNNVYSPFFDPRYTMSITVNGQLVLSMLAERFMRIQGLEMIQANTDGVTCLVPIDQVDQFRAYCKEWEGITGLELEEVQYSMMAIRDVNNYLSVDMDGKVKRKGAYEYEMDWHQDPSALVVPKTVEMHLTTGVPVEDLIRIHWDPFDFMLRAKVPRSSRLVHGDQQIQNTSRYYITKEGPSLVKIMPPLAKNGPDAPERRIGIAVGWSVGICNKAANFDWDQLNYDYYIAEARKLIDVLK